MPTNPSGIHTLPPVTWVETGDTVLPPQHNDPFKDVEQGLTDRLMRDGRAPMTGALKMGSNKITNLATPTDATDGATKGYIDARAITDFSGTLPLNRGGTGATTAAGVRTNIGLDDIGLHMTGDVPIVANLDAVDTPSGFGYYKNLTSGTLPPNSGSSGGCFILLRRGPTAGGMLAVPAQSADTVYYRNLSGGVWGAWIPLVTDLDARLSNSREWTAATVSQSEAEAGTATTRRAWTAQRVRQAGVAAAKTVALGEGQSWVNELSNRAYNTVYQNATGRTIAVSVGNNQENSSLGLEVSANGTSNWMLLGAGSWATDMAIVPPGWRYRWTRTGTIQRWAELK